MLEDVEQVSVIIPVCNQGDHARRTVTSVREGIGDVDHELILVDDQSTDGSCHGMPKDVLIVRTQWRGGVSSARRHGFSHSCGDVLIWSDPHCFFPPGSLRHLVKAALSQEAIVQPKTVSRRRARERWGGQLVVSERGLRVARAYKEAVRFPALLGTIYAMKRSVYEKLGGWPQLPGIWGYSEQALTLRSWFLGIPIVVDPAFTCVHLDYQPNRRFPFSVSRSDWARNAHYVHALFFPLTYQSYWRPMLEGYFGGKREHVEPLETQAFQELRAEIQKSAIRSELEFFTAVLESSLPAGMTQEESNEAYIRQQALRSKPGEYKVVRPRVDAALDWMVQQLGNEALSGKRALDLGTRDGYGALALKRLGAEVAEGVEFVPETVAYSVRRRRPVRQGDMRELPDPDSSWDLVICLHTLEHCPEPARAIREMSRVLRPGGWLYIVVPRELGPSHDPCHNWCFENADELRRLVLTAGDFEEAALRESVGVLAKGNRELRLLVRRRVGD